MSDNTEAELEQEFMDDVLIDMGYVNLGDWSIENIDTEHNRITFEKS